MAFNGHYLGLVVTLHVLDGRTFKWKGFGPWVYSFDIPTNLHHLERGRPDLEAPKSLENLKKSNGGRMDIKAPRTEVSYGTCKYWLAGRCNRKQCRYLHKLTPGPPTTSHHGRQSHWFAEKKPKKKSGGDKTSSSKACQKSSQSICKYWMNGNCTHGDQCWNLHTWFQGDGFSMLAKRHEHNKIITGIALPVGSDKLFSGSTDGTVRIWDCHTGQCSNVINFGSEVRTLISEGTWVFAGVLNAVKACNTQTAVGFTLDGPKGQVFSMVVGNDTLFAGAKDGVIYAWRGSSEINSLFAPVASLSGHTRAVVCLTVGGKKLYSGSMDHTIKVWDLDTLQCTMTLKEHKNVVTSLICWDQYLLSSSLDGTVKIWAATDRGTLEVTYTHHEENGVVALGGMTDPEGKPILFCSCNDHSVRLYELPSFALRGQLFSKQEVRTIEVAPGGLFFTGDGTGLLTVWKWLAEPKMATS